MLLWRRCIAYYFSDDGTASAFNGNLNVYITSGNLYTWIVTVSGLVCRLEILKRVLFQVQSRAQRVPSRGLLPTLSSYLNIFAIASRRLLDLPQEESLEKEIFLGL